MRGPEMEPPQDAEQASLIVSRLLNAPCQSVFAAWTTVEHVQRWMCPEGATDEAGHDNPQFWVRHHDAYDG